MPIIHMHLMEGRTPEQKRAAAKAVTEAVVRTLGAQPEAVRILITELGADGFYVGGLTPAERAEAQLGAGPAPESKAVAGPHR